MSNVFYIYCEHWLKPTIQILKKNKSAQLLEKSLVDAFGNNCESTCYHALSNLENDLYYMDEIVDQNMNALDFIYGLVNMLIIALLQEADICQYRSEWTKYNDMFQRIVRSPLYMRTSFWYQRFHFTSVDSECLRRVDSIIVLSKYIGTREL